MYSSTATLVVANGYDFTMGSISDHNNAANKMASYNRWDRCCPVLTTLFVYYNLTMDITSRNTESEKIH